MRRIGYGVIGLGFFGEKHAEVLASLAGAELRALLRAELGYFLDCVTREVQPTVVTPAEARAAVAAITAAERSAAMGQVVRL